MIQPRRAPVLSLRGSLLGSFLGPLVLSMVLGALATGCSDKGQLVLGIATDLLARGQINRVAMEVRRTGEQTPIVDYKWDLAGVPAQDYRLPGSFTLVAEGGQEPTFEVLIRGQLDDQLVVERRSTLGVLTGRDLFIRLGLIGACEDIGCPGSLACVEGQCRPMAVDLRTLPPYRASLIERLDCDSGTRFVDTGTGAPMPSDTSCQAGSLCGEGTCLVDPATLPSADPRPFLGGPAELYSSARLPGGFFSVGPLDAARYRATATLLNDGRVLIVGGSSSAAIDASAQPVPGAAIYDPSTASFRRLPDPPGALVGHTATRVEQGSSAGNVVFVGTALGMATAFEFDPRTDQFSSLPTPREARYYHTTSLLPNNKLLVYGGTRNRGGFELVGGGELYDLTSRTWSLTKVGPVRTRAFHSASPLPDGRILFAGGVDMGGNPLVEVEAYDSTIDEFRSERPLRLPRAVHSATALSDGTTLIVGGQTDRSAIAITEVELYVPQGRPEVVQPEGAPLARTAHQAVLLTGDRVLFVDGASALSPSLIQPAGGAFLYDHAKRSFALLPAPQRARITGFAVRLADGDVLIGGGNAEVAPGGDGGVLPDAALSPDLSIQYCDPVANLGAVTCSGATPRCGIPGKRAYGPRFDTTMGPTCIQEGTVPIGNTCTVAVAAESTDACVAGGLCVRDEFDMLRCQHVCHLDTDCAPVGMGPSTCARILTGPGVSDVGVCMNPCAVFGGEDCMLTGGGDCRFALSQPSAGAPVQAQGVCMASGVLSIGMACTRDDYATECSYNEACLAGRCEYLCDNQLSCDQSPVSGSKCVGLAPAFPSTSGYCKSDLDMGSSAPDLSPVGLE